MKLSLVIRETFGVCLKRYFIKGILFSFFISWISCTRNAVEDKKEIKPITLKRLFIEETYTDQIKVFANDSILCIDKGKDNYIVWKNGQLSEKKNKELRYMMENNESAKFFHEYKYRSELMRLDFRILNSNLLS